MEFRKINSTKLKVRLTDGECLELGISLSGGEACGLSMRDAVRTVVSRAEEAVGFTSEGEKLLVQIYPAEHSGAEMLITKLSGVGDRERTVLAEARSLTTYEERGVTFRFSDLDTLSAAASAAGRDSAASLLSHPDGSYYLTLTEELVDGFSDFDLFLEYGTRVTAAEMHSQSEYLTLLFSEVRLSTLALL